MEQVVVASPRKPATCRGCGVDFMARVGTRQKGHYCTRECAFAHPEGWRRPRAEKPAPRVRDCRECGNPCPTLRAWYCGDECRKASACRKESDRGRRAHQQRVKESDCRECGMTFKPTYPSKRKAFCSDLCCKRHSHRNGKHIRRARERSQFVAPVSFADILNRDGAICQLCHTRTKGNRDPFDPLSPTLDHIIPIAKGGTHEPKNVQIAHRICNSLKGANAVGEQLRLVG